MVFTRERVVATDHGNVEEGFARCSGPFVVLAASAVACHPSEGPLDDSPLEKHDKAVHAHRTGVDGVVESEFRLRCEPDGLTYCDARARQCEIVGPASKSITPATTNRRGRDEWTLGLLQGLPR